MVIRDRDGGKYVNRMKYSKQNQFLIECTMKLFTIEIHSCKYRLFNRRPERFFTNIRKFGFL